MVENLFVKKNPLQDLLSSLNAVISTNERNWILTGHVIFKLRYNQIYQLKTTEETDEYYDEGEYFYQEYDENGEDLGYYSYNDENEDNGMER